MTALAIYPSKVFHARFTPKKHTFSYRTQYHFFNLDELNQLSKATALYSHNQFNVFSLSDQDYLGWEPGTLRQRVERLLERDGLSEKPFKIHLLTCPRFLNYTFNPVSFFFCEDQKSKLQSIIVEINNTFKEKHVYLLNDLRPAAEPGYLEAKRQKTFHVSPFYDLNMSYRFMFKPIEEDFEIRILLEREGAPIFFSNLTGSRREGRTNTLLKEFLKAPWIPVMTMTLILWQAAILHYRRKLIVYAKPQPSSIDTLRAIPLRWRDRLGLFFLSKFFSRLRRSCLEIELPDRRLISFGNMKSPEKLRMSVRDYRFFWQAFWSGDVGFGESFVDGDWTTTDLPRLLGFFVDHADELNDRKTGWPSLGRLMNILRHRLRPNTRKGSKKNIFEHYDLGNDFFARFLDKRMQYSCGVFESNLDDLDTAQQNKMNRLIKKAQIQDTDHVLEIGCGWGELAIESVRQTGCQWTGVTVSKAQYDYATQKVAEAKLSHKIEIVLKDYRDLNGSFDKIVSCEMIEAVGHENLGTYFEVCDRLLKPNGLFVLQAITLPDQRYKSAQSKTDWIQKHIFPGSVCPSLEALSVAMTKSSRFIIDDLENIGPHYADILSRWRENFKQSRDAIMKMGFDDPFMRKWEYYLSYCEAGFRKRITNDLQLVLIRPNSKNLALTRGHYGR